MKERIGITALIAAFIFFALFQSACQSPGGNTTTNVDLTESSSDPTIEAGPVQAGEEGYKIITGDTLKLTVNAANANQAELFYQPIFASDRSVKLRTLNEKSGDSFVAEMKTPTDFNGEVWARVRYASGETKQTERLRLVSRSDNEGQSNNQQANANTSSDSANRAANIGDDESARADKATGGRIERAEIRQGEGNIRITVNVPAFHLTLWQNGREIATYPVGVGRKEFPIPVGERTAKQIILNPDWIPPDSEWVRESSSVEPYERIPADDPDNPLGKVKFPLGNAYLLHEAQAPSDLGNLVSHGCVRVMRDDIFDLAEKVAIARGISDARDKIRQSRNDTERRVINLNEPLVVDINYDTMVVEGGILYIYPDVYDRSANTVEKLRAELESYQIDVSKLDEKTLKEMLDRVTGDLKFVVSLADLRAGGNALGKGRTEPLTKQQEKEISEKSKGK